MVCEMPRETHSLNKNCGGCYFQMSSLIKNFLFSLKVFTWSWISRKKPTRLILARCHGSIGKLGVGGGRGDLGCEVPMTCWDHQRVCLGSFGTNTSCHEDTELLSAQGKPGWMWMWRRSSGSAALPLRGTDREISQLEQVFQSRLHLLLFIPVSSLARLFLTGMVSLTFPARMGDEQGWEFELCPPLSSLLPQLSPAPGLCIKHKPRALCKAFNLKCYP